MALPVPLPEDTQVFSEQVLLCSQEQLEQGLGAGSARWKWQASPLPLSPQGPGEQPPGSTLGKKQLAAYPLSFNAVLTRVPAPRGPSIFPVALLSDC